MNILYRLSLLLILPALLYAKENYFLPRFIEAEACTCWYKQDSTSYSNVIDISNKVDMAVKVFLRDTSAADIANDSVWGLQAKYQLGYPYPLASGRGYYEGGVDTAWSIMGAEFGLTYGGSADSILTDSLIQSEADSTSWDGVAGWLGKGYAVPGKDYGAGMLRMECVGLKSVKAGSWCRAVFHFFFRRAEPIREK